MEFMWCNFESYMHFWSDQTLNGLIPSHMMKLENLHPPCLCHSMNISWSVRSETRNRRQWVLSWDILTWYIYQTRQTISSSLRLFVWEISLIKFSSMLCFSLDSPLSDCSIRICFSSAGLLMKFFCGYQTVSNVSYGLSLATCSPSLRPLSVWSALLYGH